MWISSIEEYIVLRQALRAGKCKIVEGVITEFDPMPWAGHQDESFVVKGIRFEYSDFSPKAGFHQSSSHGGPIRLGLRVKIFYIETGQSRDIARLEIPQ